MINFEVSELNSLTNHIDRKHVDKISHSLANICRRLSYLIRMTHTFAENRKCSAIIGHPQNKL